MAIAARQVGYLPAATMSNNGAGKVRVTFGANVVDPGLYADIAVDGSAYMANVTHAGSAAITAKGGSLAAGFYFDLGGVNYPDASWVNADLCAPQELDGVNQYNTHALMAAAVGHGDKVYSWYSLATVKSTRWTLAAYSGAKLFNYQSGLANGQALFITLTGVVVFAFTGDMSGQATQVTVRNFTNSSSYGYACSYNDTSTTAGGVRLTRIRVHDPNFGFRFLAGGANVCQVDNCMVLGGNYATHTVIAIKVYNCTFFQASNSGGVGNTSTASTYTNVYSSVWTAVTNATITYCGDDGTAIPAANNLRSLTEAQLGFWRDALNGHFSPELGIHTTSSLYHAGVAVAGITTDFWGNTYANPPSIGAHEGSTNAFAVTWPTAAQMLKDVAVTQFSGALTGTLESTDPGEAYVLREADGGPASYKINSVTKTPAYNFTAAEAARNDAPAGFAGSKVLATYNPKIKGTTYTGTAVEESHVQSAKPGTWTIADSGDGQTWTLAVDDADNSIVYKLKNNVSNKFVASALLKSTYPNGAKIKGLVTDQTYSLYALESGKLISEPSDTTCDTNELVANYSAGAANIIAPAADRVDGTVTNGTGTSGGAMPAAPTWGTTPTTPASGQVTLSIVANAPGDTVYGRYKLKGATTWAAAGTFSRTGTGTIVITGLTNGARYIFSGYTLSGVTESEWLGGIEAIPKTTGQSTPENCLRSLLLDNAAVVALIVKRIYPQAAPQKHADDLPYIVYNRVDAEVFHKSTAASGLTISRIQLEHYASTYVAARALAEATRLALDGYQGATVTDEAGATLTQVRMRRASDGDGFSEPIGGGEFPAHRVIVDYYFSHRESVATF